MRIFRFQSRLSKHPSGAILAAYYKLEENHVENLSADQLEYLIHGATLCMVDDIDNEQHVKLTQFLEVFRLASEIHSCRLQLEAKGKMFFEMKMTEPSTPKVSRH
jgi:hypothetical protein